LFSGTLSLTAGFRTANDLSTFSQLECHIKHSSRQKAPKVATMFCVQNKTQQRLLDLNKILKMSNETSWLMIRLRDTSSNQRRKITGIKGGKS